MKAEDFWALLRRARSAAPQRKDDATLAALTLELSRLEEPALAAFEEWFRRETVALDTPDIRDVANQLWVFNPETWFNFRAWCVSRGAEFIARLHSHPSTLRAVAEACGGPFDAPSGELFLYCVDYARVTRGRPDGGIAAPERQRHE